MFIKNQMGQPQKPIAAEQTILALGRVLQSLREEEDIDVLIDISIAYIKQEFSYNLIWIACYDRLKHALLGQGGIAPTRDLNFLRKRLVLQPGDLLEQVVIQQTPLGVADIRNEKRAGEWREFGTKFNIQGTIILPMRYQDKCMGVVVLGSERWGYLLPEDAKARLMIVLGELAAILYQKELDLQYKQIKRPDEPLLKLLENVRNLNNLEERLKAVVEATHDFVCPSRTSVYWFERQGRYFWCRMSNQLVNLGRDNSEQSAAGMTVQELNDLYYALSVNQIVWIGDARSSLKGQFTAKLLQRLRVRSLLAAPIIWQKDLLGFLAVEGYEPRIWTDADKNFVQGAAGLISLVAPNDNTEDIIKQIEADSQLTSEVAQSIYTHQDLKETLRNCAARVINRLNATRFLLLHYDHDQNNYQVIYQTQPNNRRPFTSSFSLLTETDRQMLKAAKATVAVENIEEDLRFFNWRSLLLEQGVRSLLICNCAQGYKAEALLIVTHANPRSWTNQEKELMWVVSQQIGVVVRQWRLQTNNEQQQQVLQSIQKCFNIVEATENENSETRKHHLERTALEQIASVLNCPLTLLLSWSHGDSTAEIIPGVIANSRFDVLVKAIPIQYEALIQWALAENSYLSVSIDHIPPETRKWLHGTGIGQVLLKALRTGVDHQPTGVLLLADHRERYWPQQSLNAGEILIDQLAWLRRQEQISQRLESTTQQLRQLNWYKNRRLEEIQRTTTSLLGQIHDLGIPSNDLTQTRYQLLLRQLDHTATSMTAMVKQEKWQLHISWETMPIASLLKRSLERVDHIVQQQKLWVGVHGLAQPLTDKEAANGTAILKGVSAPTNPSVMAIAGDIIKFELVLHELLLAACYRSPNGNRIDIWCRRLDERFLEVSITDNGTIEAQLLTDLQQKTHKDVLAFSDFAQSPVLNLLICQHLMQQLGGELDIYQLPDHRVVSRLVMPLAEV